MADGFLRPRFKAKKRRLSFKELARFQTKTIDEVNRVLILAVASMRSDLEKSTPDVNDDILASETTKAAKPLTELLLTLDAKDFHCLKTNTLSFEQRDLQKKIESVNNRLRRGSNSDEIRLESVKRSLNRDKEAIDSRWKDLRKIFDDGYEEIRKRLNSNFDVDELWSGLRKETQNE